VQGKGRQLTSYKKNKKKGWKKKTPGKKRTLKPRRMQLGVEKRGRKAKKTTGSKRSNEAN